MNHTILPKRRRCAKRRRLPCPNCGNPIASCQATSIDFVAALYGTTTSHCLRCTLDEVELIDQDLYLDLPPVTPPLPEPQPICTNTARPRPMRHLRRQKTPAPRARARP